MKLYCVYILTNKSNTTLYIGVTSDLINRVRQHREKLVIGFTSRYNLTKLIYYECGQDINSAIAREKQLKNWRREWKINLILEDNPEFKDLYDDLM